MKTVYCIGIWLSALMALTAQAQPEFNWMKNFGGEDEDKCLDVTLTPEGGYLLVGYDKSFGRFNEDGWMVCLDENGDSLWSREFGGDSWDFFFDVIAVEGGYYISGRYASFEGHPGWDSPWVLKVDNEGREIWSRTYRHEAHGYALSGMKIDSDGGISMSGDTPSGDYDMFLRKLNADGDVVWEHAYDDEGREERSYGHCQLYDGGFLVCGEVAMPQDNDRPDAVLIRTDDRGEQVWRREYGGREFNALYDAIQLSDSTIAVIGMFDYNVWLLRIRSDGEVISSNVYENNHYGYFMKLQVLEDGGFLLSGNRDGACLIRTDAEGEQLWSLNLPESDNDAFPNVVITPDGGLAIGYSADDNFAIAKYGADPAGVWPRWDDLPVVEMNEDEPFDVTSEWLAGYLEDNDNDSTEFRFTLENGENISVAEIEGGFRLNPAENWHGADTLALVAFDPDSHWAATELIVTVESLNDLPLPFSLQNPEDGHNLNANQIAFIWEEAAQNEFEPDSIRYRLIMAREDSLVAIDDIDDPQLIFRDIPALRAQFGVPEGEGYTFTWWVEAVDRDGFTASRERWTIEVSGFQGIDPEKGLPKHFSLISVHPNPFNMSTSLRFELPEAGRLSIAIHDATGRLIDHYEIDQQSAGFYSWTWNGRDKSNTPVTSGVYLCTIEYKAQSGEYKIVTAQLTAIR